MNASALSSAAISAGTREGLITTAERLFAEDGIDGVSLRSISKHAGCGNVVAVQYHFGNKVGLLKAIFERRMPMLEDIRRRMLDEAGVELSLHQLVEILFCPLSKIVDDDGRMIYARFLLQLSSHPEYWSQASRGVPSVYRPHPLQARDGPTAASLLLLGEKIGHVPMEVLTSRVTHLHRMFVGALIDHENAIASGLTPWPLERLIDDQIGMIASALATPQTVGAAPASAQ